MDIYNELETDLKSLLKIRSLWDTINYDLAYWVEIAKKKVNQEPENKNSWNLLGDMLWKLSPDIDKGLLEVESLSVSLQKTKNETNPKVPLQLNPAFDQFYLETSRVMMQIALVIKITDVLKEMAKPTKTLSPSDINKLIESINCPLNSKNYKSPIRIIEEEIEFRGI
jgi:hypothetical protein